MCGITGIVSKLGSKIDEFTLTRLNNLISHRGPDSSGIYLYNNLGLAHRRLSILDLSILGHQPMVYEDRYIITYNGEIYNYIELRDELLKLGYNFKSNTDTEVIIASYDAWGPESLNKFNGMWAFALFDKFKNELFISRDRFGVKPLYYRENNDFFTFGSEIKQLLNENGSNKVNEDVLLESMLTYVDNHNENTYFKDIYSFPASHYMVFNLNDYTRKFIKYYSLNASKSYSGFTPDNFVEKFKNLLEDSIKLRLRSDVKVGTCLSGGLDSSSISVIASKIYHNLSERKFVGINAKSIDRLNDESGFAKIVSDFSDIDLNIVMPTYEDFVSTIDEVIFTQEEPFGSPSMFMGWHVFQKAKELGCTVMLNGQGGDEILLGYERYFTSTLSLFNPFSFVYKILNQVKNSRLSIINILVYYFYFRNSWLRIIRLKKRSFLKKSFIKNNYFNTIKRSAEVYSNVSDLQLYEIRGIQLPHLLRYEDRNSMRHSIETRLPFLDYRLVEFSISLPLKYKIQNGWTKWILRKAVESLLPRDVVWRKNKFGFEAPDKIWLNKYELNMKKEIEQSQLLNHYCHLGCILKDYEKLSLKDKWMYFNIARWEKVYNVSL
jgi:asparagine synthase (glutamine-hydrolysing)